MNGDQLAKYFKRNLSVIETQSEGLSHADSVLQFPFRSNCLNWTLGHLVVNRDNVLELVGEKGLFNEQETQRYQHGSEPVLEDGPDIVSLERLLSLMNEAQVSLDAKLPELTPAEFDREFQRGENMVTVENRIALLVLA